MNSTPRVTTEPAFTPVVHCLSGDLEIEVALRAFGKLPHPILLDSAKVLPKLGRYSFLAADPFEIVRVDDVSLDPLAQINQAIRRFATDTISGLPPFQGGAAGLLTYELGQCFESIPLPLFDDQHLPLAVLGLYDVVIAWDHVSNGCWLISQGWPELDSERRRARAEERANYFLSLLSRGSSDSVDPIDYTSHSDTLGEKQPDSDHHENESLPSFESHFGEAWRCNFAPAEFRAAVARAVEYIHAGDIFQVNLSQRWEHPAVCSSLDLYCELREVNPAPFAGYFDIGSAQIISASPERFLQVRDRIVETRPIKGTRQRSTNPQLDLYIGDSLQESRKDRSENVMIVDLLRNDLSRVCEIDSIRVDELCAVERYEYVLHLVSSVSGRLRQGLRLVDLIYASFPGGSITGAPKVRAMEIIAEIEPTRRGAYCGSLGYIGFDGSMDWSIAIRTITASGGKWFVNAGGGIVADSTTSSEEKETWHKAEGLVRAIEQVARVARSKETKRAIEERYSSVPSNESVAHAETELTSKSSAKP